MTDTTQEARTWKGLRPCWVYHDPCDDGVAGGDGHMKVHQVQDGFVYKCQTCGEALDYEEVS